MADTQHTPGPFTIEHQEDISEGNGYAWAIRGWQSEDAFQKPYVQNPAYANSKANAEFVIRACNSHDALLAALTQLMEWEGDEAGFYPEDDTQQRANEVWQDAFDAVAKARGVAQKGMSD
jgi:hypothetical protein